MGTPRKKSRKRLSSSPAMPTPKSKVQKTNPADVSLIMNDDEEERIARHNQQNKRPGGSLGATPLAKRPNFDNSDIEIQQQVELCSKLYSENRISGKNAWNLNIISAIQQLLKSTKQSNVFQVVGQSLDVGAKVYSCRVDDIYQRGVQLSTKMVSDQSTATAGDQDDVFDESVSKTKRQKKPKKLSKKNVLGSDIEQLTASLSKLETVLSLGRENIDDIGANNLVSLNVPVHPSSQNFLLHSSEFWVKGEDAICATTAKTNVLLSKNAESFALSAAFSDFNIGEEVLNDSNAFNNSLVLDDAGVPLVDLDGSIPDLFEDQDNDNDIEPLTNINDEIPKEIVNIDEAISNKNFIETDYGYFLKNLVDTNSWNGPSYWKLKSNKPTRAISSIPKPIVKVKHGKKKVINKVDFDVSLNEEEEITVPKIKKHSNERLLFSMLDLNLLNAPNSINSSSNRNELRIVSEISLQPLSPIHEEESSEHIINDYDGMDTSNGPEDFTVEENVAAAQENFLSEHLVDAPETVEVEVATINFARHAKKIDMRNIKQSVWKCLQQNESSEKITPNTFKKLYKELLNMISESTKHELSPHIALAALLHLCNDKALRLIGQENRKDFKIQMFTD